MIFWRASRGLWGALEAFDRVWHEFSRHPISTTTGFPPPPSPSARHLQQLTRRLHLPHGAADSIRRAADVREQDHRRANRFALALFPFAQGRQAAVERGGELRLGHVQRHPGVANLARRQVVQLHLGRPALGIGQHLLHRRDDPLSVLVHGLASPNPGGSERGKMKS